MIAKLITERLNERRELFAFQITDNNWGSWTFLLKETIAILGSEMPSELKDKYTNINTCASGKSKYFAGGEWLFDLVWYEDDYAAETGDDMNVMKSIPLVLESEMSKINWGGFKEDFDKLLLATASTRIFVTRIKDETKIGNSLSKKLQYAKKAIQSFDSVDSVFIIVWNENEMDSDEPFKLIEISKD